MECASEAESTLFLNKNSKLQLVYQESYVDLNDEKNFIKSYLNDEYFLSMDKAYDTDANLFLRQGLVELETKIDTFTTVSRMTENYIPYTEGLPLVSIYFRVDNKQDLVRLRRYDWVKILGDVGGIGAFVVEFIFFILHHFTHIDFMTQIIRSLYL